MLSNDIKDRMRMRVEMIVTFTQTQLDLELRSGESCAHEKKCVVHAPGNVFCVHVLRWCTLAVLRKSLPACRRGRGPAVRVREKHPFFAIKAFNSCTCKKKVQSCVRRLEPNACDEIR